MKTLKTKKTFLVKLIIHLIQTSEGKYLIKTNSMICFYKSTTSRESILNRIKKKTTGLS